jgi:hypothetical protein
MFSLTVNDVGFRRLITFLLQEMGRQMLTELDSHLVIFNKTLLELEFQAAQKDHTHFVLLLWRSVHSRTVCLYVED